MLRGRLPANRAPEVQEKKTRRVWVNQLATHLPDVVVFVDHTKEMPFQNKFQGVLMFLDISGFTALCEQYAMNSKNGTDQLTKTLNGYMEALVSEILNSDGDVLKFAGDAILTLWKVDSFMKMKATIHQVISCAMNIQKRYGEWTTSVGVKLRVKIGIAAGEVSVTFVGHSEFCHYVTLGRAVEAVNLAEKNCKSGDVVASPSIWCHCSGLDIEHEVLDDNKHIKILGIEDAPESILYHSMNTIELTRSMGNLMPGSMTSGLKASSMSTKLSGGNSENSNVGGAQKDGAQVSQTSNIISRVRKAIIDQLEEYAEEKKKLYIAKPVLRKIEDHQPLEYLSEMRQVTIVFINLVIQECTNMELALVLQHAFDIIYTSCKRTQGCLNKIFAFDKGSTYLVIFGLPGFKHENDCAHALRCSHQMQEELANIKPIQCCSMGVTTGSTFCGVVGHNHRHEYTVIGRKVNMAARLMMHYPDKVTCDNETFHHSKLSKGYFHPVETKEMKGLSNVGTIREYKPTSDPQAGANMTLQQEFEYPMIGRDMELDLFLKEVDYIQKHQGAASQRQAIVYDGESGIGRTKLLDAAIVKALHANIKVIACSLTLHDAKSPFYAMKSLLIDLLDFSFDMSHQERENAFLEMFHNDMFIINHADLLNDILHVQFQPKESVDAKKRQSILYQVIFRVIKECNKQFGFIIFLIDDAHFMDSDSWEFVHVLGKDDHSLVVMTLRMPFAMSETAEGILNHETTLRVTLRGLDPQYLAALGCQLLGVSQIPLKLDSILRDKSHGVPSWCEQLLREMMRDGVIRIESRSFNSDLVMVTPPQIYLTKRRGAHDEHNKGTSEEMESEDSKLICVVAPNQMLDGGLPDSIKGMIQARIDRMEELDQMIIKSASVLGMSFPRRLLEEILPRNISNERFGKALQRLADCGIFVCAYPHSKHSHGNSSGTKEHFMKSATCECPLNDGTAAEKPMEDCQFIRFFATSMQETAYEMYLENTRRTLHVKAAKFLESQAHKCKACGGGNFLQTLILKQSDIEKHSLEGAEHRPHGSSSAIGTSSPARMLYGYNPALPQQREVSGSVNSLDSTLENRPHFKAERGQVRQERRRSSVAQNIRKRLNRGQTSFRAQSAHIPTGPATGNPISKRASKTDESSSRRTSLSGAAHLLTPVASSRRNSRVIRQLEPSYDDDDDVDDDQDLEIVDLRECECIKVLMSVYPQLVRHWRAAGSISKTVHYLMEASAAAISTHDNMKALSYLREVSRIMDAVNAGENPFEGEVTNIDSYRSNQWETARMDSLLGQALFHMGQMEESIPHFVLALTTLGCIQPISRASLHLALLRNGFTQWKHNHFPDSYVGRASVLQFHPLTEQARCLSHLLHWYLVNRMDQYALNTVLQQINKAEAANCDLHEVIMAYMCMMECCHVFRWHSMGEAYEYKAQARCLLAMENVTADDLVTITHFFVTSLNMRLSWGKLQKAIDSGYIAHRLSQKIHDNDMKLQLLPVLTQALIMSNRIIDAVDILRELQHTQEQTNDKMAEALYYACCLDIILETGFQLEPYSLCIKYDSCIWGLNSPCSCPKTQFYIQANVALWHMRKREWRKAQQWYRQLQGVVWGSNDTFLSIRGLVKILEFNLIKLSQTLSTNPRRCPSVMDLEVLIKSDMTQLEYICKRMPVFESRFWHLSAYNRAILGQTSLAKKFLSKAITVARKMDYELEIEWAEHSRQVWYDPDYDQIQAEFWLEHADEEMLDWHMANSVEGSIIKYSLPLPHWFKQN